MNVCVVCMCVCIYVCVWEFSGGPRKDSGPDTQIGKMPGGCVVLFLKSFRKNRRY
jgi:hypothetical protein